MPIRQVEKPITFFLSTSLHFGSYVLQYTQLNPMLACSLQEFLRLRVRPWEKFDQPDKKPRRNSAAPRSTDILCAKFPSSRESSKSTEAAVPTKSPAPTQRPHPPRRSGSRRSKETAFRASIRRATIPATPPRVDPPAAPPPVPPSPQS